MLVESHRVEGRVKQKVVARLGRLDELLASGELDRMLASLGQYSQKYTVLGEQAKGTAVTVRARTIGPALVFERLWKDLGIDQVLTEIAGGRRFWIRVGARDVFDRVALAVCLGVGSRGPEVVERLRHRWRR